HEASVATVTARRAELEALGLPEEPVDVAAAQEALRVARDAVRSATDALSRHDQAAAALSDLRDRAAAVDEGRAELERTHQIVARLADTLAGRAPNDYRMPLETYVLAAELEEIVTAANVRLDEMSSGRYRLQHTDARASRGAQSGLGLEIVDAFTAVARPAHSLSGGETFLASLALALGLAEVVTARAGGIRLDTLFIDEGFGSLDAETLDLAMRTLDELRSGGRTVGVISHVEAMKEQIPAQLVVEATGRGSSIIRQSD
ncbi:SMC family ATPase, partial [Microbacteriaceae bacterium K1510]|nr:SMC family ATPase [Microbacteriaceae bacterium K1510]